MLLKKHSLLNNLLVLLLLISSNGLALESLGHNHRLNHDGHNSPVTDVMPNANSSSMHSHGATIEQPGDIQSSDEHQDCICDEVCCVTSVNFSHINDQDAVIPNSNYTRLLLPLYQSVSLDLLLPPPTP